MSGIGQRIRIAVLVDGGFFLKRHDVIYGKGKSPLEVADNLASIVKKHVKKDYLHRVLYYDCPPYDKVHQNPVSGRRVNFAKTSQADFRQRFLEELQKRRKFALRLGYISSTGDWAIKPRQTQEILAGRLPFDNLSAEDVSLQMRQKGVDMKIGLDIASLAYKRSVDRLVLISGDSDMVPATKLARREGLDVVLDPMWNHIDPILFEHVDGLWSVCPKPASDRRAET